jgi:transposase
LLAGVPDDDRGRSLKALVAENTALREENERLARKIAELEARLSKSSQNSSMPPSSDSPGTRAEATKIRAERRAEQKRERQAEVRRRGKQVGVPGKNLPVRENPDEIVTHEPGQCSSCEEDLSGAADEGFEARQVFDVPDPKLICTEHRSVRRRCRCGTVMAGGFPPEAKAPTSYGPKLRAATLYLLHGQHLPVERTAEAISAMLGADISTGFVASLAGEAARGLSGFMDELRRRLRAARVIHVGETTTRCAPRSGGCTSWPMSCTRTCSPVTPARDPPLRRRACSGTSPASWCTTGSRCTSRQDRATLAICLAHMLRDLASVGARWN